VLLRRRRPRLPVRGERATADQSSPRPAADETGEDGEPSRGREARQPVGSGMTRG
jgi:hypothetical protein